MRTSPTAVAAQLEQFTITTKLVFELAAHYDATDEMITALASTYVRWNIEREEFEKSLDGNGIVLSQARIKLAALSGEPPMMVLHCDRRGRLDCPSYHHALFAMLTRFVPDLGLKWATSNWQPIPIGPEEKVIEALRPNDWSMLPTWGRQNLMDLTGSIAFTRIEQEVAQVDLLLRELGDTVEEVQVINAGRHGECDDVPEAHETESHGEPYLGINLDHNEKRIHRSGYTDYSSLQSRPTHWEFFLLLFNAKGTIVDADTLNDALPNPDASNKNDRRNSVVFALRGMIRSLGLDVISPRGEGSKLVEYRAPLQSPAAKKPGKEDKTKARQSPKKGSAKI